MSGQNKKQCQKFIDLEINNDILAGKEAASEIAIASDDKGRIAYHFGRTKGFLEMMFF